MSKSRKETTGDKETMSEAIQYQRSGCIRVLLANDCPLILAGIRATLVTESDLNIVGEATNRAEVQHLSQELEPDVLLLDLQMSNTLPLEMMVGLRQQCPAMKIVILTNSDNDAAIRDLVAVGVAGCLLETEPLEALVQAIRSAARGGAWFSRLIIEKLTKEPTQTKLPNLIREELVVLRLIVAGRTDRQISQELSISERTVRYRLQKIYDKLEVNSRLETAVRAVQLGLV
jgi:DNA-binding NarL/FixJ family response regulator